MYRRCEFLEESPYLRLNEGVGNTKNLRSTIFEVMMEEVSDFCEQAVREKLKSNSAYHQVTTNNVTSDHFIEIVIIVCIKILISVNL